MEEDGLESVSEYDFFSSSLSLYLTSAIIPIHLHCRFSSEEETETDSHAKQAQTGASLERTPVQPFREENEEDSSMFDRCSYVCIQMS